MYNDLLILGGGMSGMLAAATARCAEVNVGIVEPNGLGASFTGPGYRYLRWSEPLVRLLGLMGIQHEIVVHKGGLLDDTGTIHAYPESLDMAALDMVQRRHYNKTRGSMVGYSPGVMNFGGKNKRGIQVNVRDIVRWVEGHVDHYEDSAEHISGVVRTSRDVHISYRSLIVTIPLPVLAHILELDPQEAPVTKARALYAAVVEVDKDHPMLGFDFIYTPWLTAIHRVSKAGPKHLTVEWNAGEYSPNLDQRLIPDRDAAKLKIDHQGSFTNPQPGHLRPCLWGTWRPPKYTHLIGRFAEWEPRATAEGAIDKTLEVLRGW